MTRAQYGMAAVIALAIMEFMIPIIRDVSLLDRSLRSGKRSA